MTELQQPESFLWRLFKQLLHRQFPLGIDDYQELRTALSRGFGWSSREELRDLCCALWAKSPREQTMLMALFDQMPIADWGPPRSIEAPGASTDAQYPLAQPVSITTESFGNLPPISLDGVQIAKRSFIFTPLFPLSYREVAQAWRRLRHTVREGPRTELDMNATIALRTQRGVASPVVLQARKRNKARLLILIDRQGSMTPFHHLVADICRAIREAGRLENLAIYYFHNTPVEETNQTVLAAFFDQLFPTLDTVQSSIIPASDGYLFDDPGLLSPTSLQAALATHARDAGIVIFSDAGAARGRYKLQRLVDTLAFLKALRVYTKQIVWFNPLPKQQWSGNTAGQIARHIPMFALERANMQRAIDVLRGHPVHVEKPL